MRFLWRWAKRFVLALVVLTIVLLAPVAYVELACRGDAEPDTYAAILPPEHHRPETRTLMTYPEWHIVHAYAEYAEVIRTGDPHEYGFLRSVFGFWSSLCALSQASAAHGEIDSATKQMVYVIGVSFTLELGLKAAYEETLGRLFAVLRGSERAPLDMLSAQQAADYATFLQQVPWYKWDFRSDANALADTASDALRDTERRLALGLEYRAKAAYAGVIEQAVANVGADALTLRMIVNGDQAVLSGWEEISVIGETGRGIEIETPRYRALTNLMLEMVAEGIDFVEIAGNDDILFTTNSAQPSVPDAVFSAARQGFDDYRHLILVSVPELADRLRTMAAAGETVEHIHDY